MKKTYMNPELKVVRLKARQQMLAGSLQMINEDASSSAGYYNSLGRDFDFDDDEE